MNKKKLPVIVAIVACLYVLGLATIAVIFVGPTAALVKLSRMLGVIVGVPIVWLITRSRREQDTITTKAPPEPRRRQRKETHKDVGHPC